MAQIVFVLCFDAHARALAASPKDSDKNYFVALPSKGRSMLDAFIEHTKTFSAPPELIFCDGLSAMKLKGLLEKPENAALKNILKAPMIVASTYNSNALENTFDVRGYIDFKTEGNPEKIKRIVAAFYEANKTGAKIGCEDLRPVAPESRNGSSIMSRLIEMKRGVTSIVVASERLAEGAPETLTNVPAPVSPMNAVSISTFKLAFDPG